jgi:hypothetical protein
MLQVNSYFRSIPSLFHLVTDNCHARPANRCNRTALHKKFGIRAGAYKPISGHGISRLLDCER